MATFHICDDQDSGALKENMRQCKKVYNEKGQVRAPLQCITNANGTVRKPKKINLGNNFDSVLRKFYDSEQVVDKDQIEGCDDNKVDLDHLISSDKEIVLQESSKDEQLGSAEDITVIDEYGKDIWLYLYKKEETFKWPNPNYMVKQKQLSFDMRSILLDWLVAVAHEYNFREQTLYLSVNYVDRFLSVMSVVRDKFQLLGAAAMMVAVKVEEIDALKTKEWSYLTSYTYTSSQIIRMEQLLLSVLKFDLHPPTVINFLEQTCSIFRFDKKTLYLAMYLSELTFLEGNNYMHYLPSKLAIASLVLARSLLNKETPYFLSFELTCGYNYDQLKPVIVKLHQSLRDASSKELQMIRYKYKREEYYCIANVIEPLHDGFEN